MTQKLIQKSQALIRDILAMTEGLKYTKWEYLKKQIKIHRKEQKK